MTIKNTNSGNHSAHLDSTVPGIPTFKETTHLVATLLALMIFATFVITVAVGSKFYLIKKDQITKQQWMAVQNYLASDKDDNMTDSDKIMKMESKSGSYTDYSVNELSHARTEGRSVVIFFNSSDSIESKNIDDNLLAFKNKIPLTMHILNASYENSVDLKTKYEITVPNTFVKVDQDGKLLKKTTGLKNLEDIIAFVE